MIYETSGREKKHVASDTMIIAIVKPMIKTIHNIGFSNTISPFFQILNGLKLLTLIQIYIYIIKNAINRWLK
jgi:hypothetical protein